MMTMLRTATGKAVAALLVLIGSYGLSELMTPCGPREPAGTFRTGFTQRASVIIVIPKTQLEPEPQVNVVSTPSAPVPMPSQMLTPAVYEQSLAGRTTVMVTTPDGRTHTTSIIAIDGAAMLPQAAPSKADQFRAMQSSTPARITADRDAAPATNVVAL